MKFKKRNIFESILDSVEADEVIDNDDVSIEEKAIYIIYNDNITDKENTDVIIERISTILKKSNFIAKFNKPEYIDDEYSKKSFYLDENYYIILFRFEQNPNASLDDFCKLIRLIDINTNIHSMFYENGELNYRLGFNTFTRYDILINNSYNREDEKFITFFRSFFPDASKEQILKSFIRACVRFSNDQAKFSPEQKWFTIKIDFDENFVNKNGDFMFKKPLKYVDRFSDGYALIKIDDKKQYISENGVILSSDKWLPAKSFENGYAIVLNPNYGKKVVLDLYGIINTKGELVTNTWYTKIISYSKDGIALVEERYYQVLIDLTGKRKFPELRNGYEYCSYFTNGFAIIRKNDSGNDYVYNFVDEEGNLLYEEYEWFKWCMDFSDGYAVVELNDNDEDAYNYIDENGDFLLSKDRKKCHNFHEGYAVVSDSKDPTRWNFIDLNGKEISDESFFDVVSDFHDGVAVVKNEENKYTYIGTDGKMLFPGKWFDLCLNFENGIAKIYVDSKINFIDKKGNELLPKRECIDDEESCKITDNMIVFNRLGIAYDFNGNLISII